MVSKTSNSEIVIDPDGNVVRKRAWSNPASLRRDLEELIGPVESPTKPEDLGLKFDLQTANAAHNVVDRIEVPRGLVPIVVEPVFDERKTPFYVKLRADAEAALLRDGTGKLYLGFHMDPLYDFHWNNLTKPIHVEIDAGGSTVVPESLDGPKVEVQADVDPREFLVDVQSWDDGQPLRLTVEYFACNDEKGICVAVEQEYRVHAQFDPDSGWPALRNYPRPLNETK